MLCDCKPSVGGDDQGGGSGDVKCVQRVTAGSTGVNDHFVRVNWNLDGIVTHDACESGDLFDRLAFHTQGDHKSGDLGRGCLPLHDLLHHGGGLLFRQVLPADQLLNGLFHSL